MSVWPRRAAVYSSNWRKKLISTLWLTAYFRKWRSWGDWKFLGILNFFITNSYRTNYFWFRYKRNFEITCKILVGMQPDVQICRNGCITAKESIYMLGLHTEKTDIIVLSMLLYTNHKIIPQFNFRQNRSLTSRAILPNTYLHTSTYKIHVNAEMHFVEITTAT